MVKKRVCKKFTKTRKGRRCIRFGKPRGRVDDWRKRDLEKEERDWSRRRTLTLATVEDMFKGEVAEGTINTVTTPHYSLIEYIEMLKDMGWEVDESK